MEDIFQKACLVQLATSCWQGSLKLPQNVMEQIGDSQWLRGHKYLVDPEYLNTIRAVISRARKKLAAHTLPFPITGLILVPKDSLQKVESRLTSFKNAFMVEVLHFLELYDQAREQAREKLGPHFNELDYPLDIQGKFAFDWRYVTIGTPGKHSILTPELFEREREAFLQLMEETRQTAVATLRGEFTTFVEHLIERLQPTENGKQKVFKTSTVSRFQEFLDAFDNRNLFVDDELEVLVAKARDLVHGVKPDWIRDDPQFKHHLKNGMQRIAAEITNDFITTAPRRRIVIPEAA